MALEYAYTDAARERSPVATLLHLDSKGNVVLRKPTRAWSDAAFCADGELLLNGLGELFDASTGELIHIFEFPR